MSGVSMVSLTGDAYLRGLRADNRLLNKLKKERDDAKALAVLRDVAFDLETKTDNCRNSGDGLGKEIKVWVHTKAGDKEIGGFKVFYVQIRKNRMQPDSRGYVSVSDPTTLAQIQAQYGRAAQPKAKATPAALARKQPPPPKPAPQPTPAHIVDYILQEILSPVPERNAAILKYCAELPPVPAGLPTSHP